LSPREPQGSGDPRILRADGSTRRFCALIEGASQPMEPKTAAGLARFRPERLSAILDPARAGQSAASVLGVTHAAPVVATLEQARAAGANALLLGTAPVGGRVPPAWRGWIAGALGRGWDVWSGLHEELRDDPEFAALARSHDATLVDLRHVPEDLPVAELRAAPLAAHVVLTVGSDCNVGKMTAAWAIAEELSRRGERAVFVATGQTGILLSGWGLAVDRARADFVAGAAELLILEGARLADWVIVEGQGSLLHPGYSGVTLGLLHGCQPRSLVLCHQAGRDHIRHGGNPIPSLERLVSLYEEAAEWIRPAPVTGIALNTYGWGQEEAQKERKRAHAETGLPVADVAVEGAGVLVENLMRARVTSRAEKGLGG
jgi:D-glutamate N-acetyltransferase